MEAILLAAGLSRRLGTGEQKILKEFEGEKLVIRAIDACLTHFDTILVTGYKADETYKCVESHLKFRCFQHECRIVFNPEYKKGQFSSCIAGLKQASGDFAFMLSDMPYLDSAFIAKTYGAFLSIPKDMNVLRPYVGEVPIHPVFMKSSVKRTLLDYWNRGYFDINIGWIMETDDRFRVLRLAVKEERYAKDVDSLEDFLL